MLIVYVWILVIEKKLSKTRFKPFYRPFAQPLVLIDKISIFICFVLRFLGTILLLGTHYGSARVSLCISWNCLCLLLCVCPPPAMPDFNDFFSNSKKLNFWEFKTFFKNFSIKIAHRNLTTFFALEKNLGKFAQILKFSCATKILSKANQQKLFCRIWQAMRLPC